MNLLLHIIAIGILATALSDLWALAAKKFLGLPVANWAAVGRWFGHMPRGKFLHAKIADAAPVKYELALGWAAHYVIGIFFAGVLLAWRGAGWAHDPEFLPALAVGLATLIFPFFIMQPAMGNGIAAAKTPNPKAARLRSLLTHAVFGVCLYLAGLVWSFTI